MKETWPRILPAVNKCLAAAADGSWFNCLLGIIDPAAGITEDVLACTVRSSEQSYASAGAHGDQLSARAAARAEEFIEKRGYRFAP